MNKKLLIIIVGIIIFILICLIAGIVLFFIFKDKPTANEIEFIQETNGGVPFRWEYEIEDESIIELSKQYDYVSPLDRQKTGAPVYKHYVFKAKKEGTTKITFKYVSITNEDYPPTIQERLVSVDKNLRITEIK